MPLSKSPSKVAQTLRALYGHPRNWQTRCCPIDAKVYELRTLHASDDPHVPAILCASTYMELRACDVNG